MSVPFETLAANERERKRIESGQKIEEHSGRARSLVAGINLWNVVPGLTDQHALVYAAAQVEATLALVEAVRSLTERLDQ